MAIKSAYTDRAESIRAARSGSSSSDSWSYASGIYQRQAAIINSRTKLAMMGVDPDTVDGRTKDPWWMGGLKTMESLGIAADWLGGAETRILLKGITNVVQGKPITQGLIVKDGEIDPFSEGTGSHAISGKELLLSWGMSRENDEKGKLDLIDILAFGLEVGADPTTYFTLGAKPFVQAALKGGSLALRKTASKVVAEAGAEIATKSAAKLATESSGKAGKLLDVLSETLPEEATDVEAHAHLLKKFAAVDELDRLGIIEDGVVRKKLGVARAGLYSSAESTKDDISDIGKAFGVTAEDLKNPEIASQVRNKIKLAESVVSDAYDKDTALSDLKKLAMKDQFNDTGGLKFGLQGVPGLQNKGLTVTLMSQDQIDSLIYKAGLDKVAAAWKRSLPGRSIMRTFVTDYKIHQLAEDDPILANSLKQIKTMARSRMAGDMKVALDGLIESVKPLKTPAGRAKVATAMEMPGEVIANLTDMVDDAPLTHMRAVRSVLDAGEFSTEQLAAVEGDEPSLLKSLLAASGADGDTIRAALDHLPQQERKWAQNAVVGYLRGDIGKIQGNMVSAIDRMQQIASKRASKEALAVLSEEAGVKVKATQLDKLGLRAKYEALLPQVDGALLSATDNVEYMEIASELAKNQKLYYDFQLPRTMNGREIGDLDFSDVTPGELHKQLVKWSSDMKGLTPYEKARAVVGLMRRISKQGEEIDRYLSPMEEVAEGVEDVFAKSYEAAAAKAQKDEASFFAATNARDAMVLELFQVLNLPVDDTAISVKEVIEQATKAQTAMDKRISALKAGADPATTWNPPVADGVSPFGWGTKDYYLDAAQVARFGGDAGAVSYALHMGTVVDSARIAFPNGYNGKPLSVVRKTIEESPQKKLSLAEALVHNGQSAYDHILYHAGDAKDYGEDIAFLTADIDEALGIPVVRTYTSPVHANAYGGDVLRVSADVKHPYVISKTDLEAVRSPYKKTIKISESVKKVRLIDLPDYGYDAIHIIDENSPATVMLLPDGSLFHHMMQPEYAKQGLKFEVPKGMSAIQKETSTRPLFISYSEPGAAVHQLVVSGNQAAQIRGTAKSVKSRALIARAQELIPEIKDKAFVTIKNVDGYVGSARLLDFDPDSLPSYNGAYSVFRVDAPEWVDKAGKYVPGNEASKALVEAAEAAAERENPLSNKVFEPSDLNPVRLKFKPSDPKTFHSSLVKVESKYGLSPYTEEELSHMQLFLENGGKTGFAIKKSVDYAEEGKNNLELVSVFRLDSDPVKGSGAHGVVLGINEAMKEGADDIFLDCYDTAASKIDPSPKGLPDYYERFGFRNTGQVFEWDPEWAPNDTLKAKYPKPGDGPVVRVMKLDKKAWEKFLKDNPQALSHGRMSGVQYVRSSIEVDPAILKAAKDGLAGIDVDPALKDTPEYRSLLGEGISRQEEQAAYARYVEGEFDALPKDGIGYSLGTREFSEMSGAQQEAVKALYMGEPPHSALTGLPVDEAEEAITFGSALRQFRDDMALNPRIDGSAENIVAPVGLEPISDTAMEGFRTGSMDFDVPDDVARLDTVHYEYLDKNFADLTPVQKKAAARITSLLQTTLDGMKQRGMILSDFEDYFAERRATIKAHIGDAEIQISPAVSSGAVSALNARFSKPGEWSTFAEAVARTGKSETYKDTGALVTKAHDLSSRISTMEWPDSLTLPQREQRVKEMVGLAFGLPAKEWDVINPTTWMQQGQTYLPHVKAADDKFNFLRRFLGLYDPSDTVARTGGGRMTERMVNTETERTIQGSIAEINNLFGEEFFYEDPAKAISIYLQRAVQAMNAHDFFEELKRMRDSEIGPALKPAKFTVHRDGSTEWLADEGYKVFSLPELNTKKSALPEGWRELYDAAAVEGIERDGLLRFQADARIVDEVEKSVKGFFSDEQMAEWMKVYDKVQGIWKGYATCLRPGFHMRNALTNVWQNAMAGVVNPARYKQAMEIQLASSAIDKEITRAMLDEGVRLSPSEAADRLIEAGKIKAKSYWISGHEVPVDRLYSMLKDHNVLGAGRIGADIHLFTEQELARLRPLRGGLNPLSQAWKPMQWGRAIGETVENNARAAHFLEMLDLTGDPAAASWSVKKYLFDYNDLTDIERSVFKRGLPFYTWIRKNLELQFSLLATRPMPIVTGIRAQTRLDQTADINEPQWAKESGAFAIPGLTMGKINAVMNKITGGAMKLDEASDTPVTMSVGLPYQDLMQLNGKDLFGMVSPIIKAPIEKVTNYSVFMGRPVQDYDGELSAAPASLQSVNSFVQAHGSEETKASWSALADTVGFGVVDGELKTTPWFTYFWQQFGPHVEAYGKALNAGNEQQAGYLINLLTGVRFAGQNQEQAVYQNLSDEATMYEDYLKALEDRGMVVPNLSDLSGAQKKALQRQKDNLK